MRSTFSTFQSVGSSGTSALVGSGLTDPSVIEAYVNRRVVDPSLISGAGPRYADFFPAQVG